MMNRILLLLSLVLADVLGLGYTPTALTTRARRKSVMSPLAGWFDFNPVHGGGSGGSKEFLDEQWEAQQAILRARRGEKELLKQKYKEKQKFQVSSTVPPPVSRGDAMYFASSEPPKKLQAQAAAKKSSPAPTPQAPSFKFPWDK
jgi:hypothetical protein